MGCFTGVGSCLPFCKRGDGPDAAKVAKKTAKKWRKSKKKKKELEEFKEGHDGVAFQVTLNMNPKGTPDLVPATPRPASRVNIIKVHSYKTGSDTDEADRKRRENLQSRSENLRKGYEERREACLRNKEEADLAFRDKALKQIRSKELIHTEAIKKLEARNQDSRPRKRLRSAINRAKRMNGSVSPSPCPTPCVTEDEEKERADKEERSSLDAFYDQ